MKKEKNNIFWTFSGKYGKMSKKVKNDEKGNILLKKAKLMKNENNNIFWNFFSKIWKNVEKSEK